MGGGNLEVVKERLRMHNEYVRRARLFADCVLSKLVNSTIILYGSVARGDFNEWSDIDVLVITKDEIPLKPVERLDYIYECLEKEPRIEPVILTYDEFVRLLAKRNPLIVEAMEKGIVLADNISISRKSP